jgi:molybdopterin biosynthesis enzyme
MQRSRRSAGSAATQARPSAEMPRGTRSPTAKPGSNAGLPWASSRKVMPAPAFAASATVACTSFASSCIGARAGLAQLQRAEIGLAETHHRHAEREAAVDAFEVAELAERVGQAHHGRTRQAGACRELADAQAVLAAPVAAQHREATRQRGDELRVFMLRRRLRRHRGCVRVHVPIRGM